MHEYKLLGKRFGYVEMSEDNEKLFWFVHDTRLMGLELALEVHPNVNDIECGKLSMQLRLRELFSFFGKLEAEHVRQKNRPND